MKHGPLTNSDRIKRAVRAFPWLPWSFLRIYVYPSLVRGRRVRGALNDFFDDFYNEVARARPIDDAATISPYYDPMHAALHYNAVEGSILRAFADRGGERVRSILDIGSGAGHWIDFFRRELEPEVCVGTELSGPAVDFLCDKYRRCSDVTIRRSDIVDGAPADGTFDVVVAIGVMFHIVNDEDLERALTNVASVTATGGYVLIGGHFGWTTRDIMFVPTADGMRVTKRIRSLRWWRKAASRVGLRVVGVQRTRNPRGFLFPENNVLVLQRPPAGP